MYSKVEMNFNTLRQVGRLCEHPLSPLIDSKLLWGLSEK
ncbi:hypothetical protein VCHA29O37_550002 [Vibrio chagasii]|nr:hypothetical protein VCHA29O37_550002 [Vibrio chagasii]